MLNDRDSEFIDINLNRWVLAKMLGRELAEKAEAVKEKTESLAVCGLPSTSVATMRQSTLRIIAAMRGDLDAIERALTGGECADRECTERKESNSEAWEWEVELEGAYKNRGLGAIVFSTTHRVIALLNKLDVEIMGKRLENALNREIVDIRADVAERKESDSEAWEWDSGAWEWEVELEGAYNNRGLGAIVFSTTHRVIALLNKLDVEVMGKRLENVLNREIVDIRADVAEARKQG